MYRSAKGALTNVAMCRYLDLSFSAGSTPPGTSVAAVAAAQPSISPRSIVGNGCFPKRLPLLVRVTVFQTIDNK